MTSHDDQSEVFLNSDAMNDKFFINIVKKKLNISEDSFKVCLVLLAPATGQNENYLSVLYRAKIKVEILETKKIQLVQVIIKALLELIPELKEFCVFPRERFMYENVLSSFEKIWLDRAGEEVSFGPKSIKFESDPYEIIVLDDLKASKYEMLNRKIGLNLPQSKITLMKLAKFHAASVICYQQNGTLNDFLSREKISKLPDDSPFVLNFHKIFNAFVESMKRTGDCEEYVEKIEKWDQKALNTQFIEVAKPMRSGFQVLNHGDLWVNNMMFKFDEENNPTDVSMIDFQMSFWASPGADLLYFLISSVADDIKVKHFDELIKYYHDELSSALKKLNSDHQMPSLAELYEDLHDKSTFGVACLMFIMFVVKYDSKEEIDMGMIMHGNNSEMLERVYNNETYKRSLRSWLPFLNERGYLDTSIKPEINEQN